MSSSRAQRLDEFQLKARLDELRHEFNELRSGSVQFIGGASILRKNSQTASTWDWNGTLPDPSHTGTGQVRLVVTATALHMPAFWGQLQGSLYVDNTSNLYDGLQYLNDTVTANNPIIGAYSDASSPSPQSKSWFVTYTGNSSRSCWIKFFVHGIDDATVTVAQV